VFHHQLRQLVAIDENDALGGGAFGVLLGLGREARGGYEDAFPGPFVIKST
jgi:hypothetical protein